jgi:hypothetical protein
VRPGGVLPTYTMIPNVLVSVTKSIKADELATAMVNEVVGEGDGTRTLECDVPRNKVRELLRKDK